MVAIKFYQIFLGPVKGDFCEFYPTCSYYGFLAIKERGLLGIVMTADRLHRCHHDLHFYDTILVGDKIKYLDVIEINNNE